MAISSTILLALLAMPLAADPAASPQVEAGDGNVPAGSAQHGGLHLPPGVSAAPVLLGDANWFREEDRPRDVGPDDHGTTVFNFIISQEGRISSCEVVKSSGYASLDRATCSLAIKRARFKPELDMDGKPLESHGRRAANW